MSGNKGEIRILGLEDRIGFEVAIDAEIEGCEGWEVQLVVATAGENAYSVTQLSIRPSSRLGGAPPPGGLSTSTLRAVPITRIVREAFQGRRLGPVLEVHYPGVGAEIEERGKGGRPSRGLEFYAQVASDWERLTTEGGGALGRLAAERKVPQSTAKNWITAATQRGLLDPALRRGPGWRQITDKARAVLAATEGGGGAL